ncbi:hypothetical protein CL614_06255 [archaeon]|nr:hypothetical protein [archaeon]|tara:strand:+ start:438 stop:1817 length:1380 start_codon:yes stop_codon:yes gene_type:complete
MDDDNHKEDEGQKIAEQSVVKDVVAVDYSMSEKEEKYDTQKLKGFGKTLLKFGKKYWVPILLLVIFILAFNMRLSGFVMPDGSYRWPYLRNIDSYALMHQMELILDNGGIMPAVDPLVLAPEGAVLTPHLYPYQYIGAYGYLAVKAFIPEFQLWEFLIYLPALLAALMVIPAYYIGKLLYDKKVGIIAAFLIVFAPTITGRSLAGDPDTDAVAMLFTLATMALFLFAYKGIKRDSFTLKNVIWAVVAGVMMSVYSYTWAGAWHIPLLILAFVFLLIVIAFVLNRGSIMDRIKNVWKTKKHVIYSTAIVFLTFVLVMSIFFGFNYVPDTVFGTPIGMLGLFGQEITFTSEEGRQFPNVYVSVAELQSGGDINSVAQRIGPIFFVLTFVFAIPYLLLSYIMTKKHLDTIVLILLWTIGSLVASMAAMRFSIILAPPVIIGASIIISKIWRLALGQDKKLLQ